MKGDPVGSTVQPRCDVHDSDAVREDLALIFPQQ